MTATRRRLPIARVAIGLVALTVAVVVGHRAGMHLPRFAAWVDGLGPWGPAVFVATYVVATVAFVPGGILTLASGALFGFVGGTLYAFLGETLGGCAAFFLARGIARNAIERRIAANPNFRAIDAAVRARGRTIIFLLRLSPAVPFNFLNYALGLTNVRFVDYLVASLGMLPGTLLYVYYGRLASDVAALAEGEGVQRGAAYYAVLALGLVATIVATTVVTRLARNALASVAPATTVKPAAGQAEPKLGATVPPG